MKANEEAKETELEGQDESEVAEELQPNRRKIHKLFYFISVVAMMAALGMATGQVVGLVFKKVGPIQIALRAYVIGLSFLVLFTEMEMTKLARENIILHNWICRGLIYSFIGVIGLEENDSLEFKSDPPLGTDSAEWFMDVVCWIIIGVGVVYFIMGILCIQRRYEWERLEYTEKSAQAVLAMRDLRNRRSNKKGGNKANNAQENA